MIKKKFLEDRKVVLRPIIKSGGMNPKGHDGEFMYSGTEIHFVLPYSIRKGRLENPLTPDEQEFFEKSLGEDLSTHKKEDNFWHTFRIKIRKDDALMQNGYELDLNDPVDYLRYKVLLIHPDVAPSWRERFRKGEYKFAMTEKDELVENTARIADKKKKAYLFLGKIDGSQERMRNFLRVYGKSVSDGANTDFLISEIDKLIEDKKNLDKVLEIIEDPNYEMKLFIEDAVECGAMLKKGRKYYLQGGDAINENDPSIVGTVEQLNKYKDEVDDIYLRMDTQIKNYKK